jgi:hypothetical protein
MILGCLIHCHDRYGALLGSLGSAVSEGLSLFRLRSNTVSRTMPQRAGVLRRSGPHQNSSYLALLLIAWAVAVSLAGSAQAQGRRALVVGIDSYSEVTPLLKARNDAAAVHGMLVSAGFEADLMLDAGQIELLTGVNNFVSRIIPGDEVVFFFAGHGVEIEGRNYLLPSDVPRATPGTEILVTARSLALDTVIALIEGRGARASLLIVDACRDNPFPRQGTRSLGSSRGLARVAAAPEGTFIMFSAGQGQAALDRLSEDDPDPNSVFTRVLLPRLDEPGLAVHEMARLVRTEVRQIARSVGHEQFPAVYDQFDGSFMLVPAAQPVVPDPPLAAPQDTCVELLPLWQLLSQNDDIAALTAFASSYAERCATLAALARSRIAFITDQIQNHSAQTDGLGHSPEAVASDTVEETAHNELDATPLQTSEVAPLVDSLPVNDISVTQAELDHIRFVLVQAEGRSGRLESRSHAGGDILDSAERDALARFNLAARNIELSADNPGVRTLTRESADALLSTPLAPQRPRTRDRNELSQHREWYSYRIRNRCEISTFAQSVSSPMLTTLPEMRISTERQGNQRSHLFLWDIVQPDQFNDGEVDAFIDGRRYSLVRVSEGDSFRIHVGSREVSETFLREMRIGQTLEVRGSHSFTGEQFSINYSLIGFTAALRRAIGLCAETPQATSDGYMRILTETQYRASMQRGAFLENGNILTLSGSNWTVTHDRRIISEGQWSWENGRFCRVVSFAPTFSELLPRECFDIEVRGNQIRATGQSGRILTLRLND